MERSNEFILSDFSCDFCQLTFEHGEDLKSHIQTQHGVSKKEHFEFCCDFCSDTFESGDILKSHVQTFHGDFQSDFQSDEEQTEYNMDASTLCETRMSHDCDMCDKSFSTPAPLTKHIRNVHEKSNYKCNFCKLQ